MRYLEVTVDTVVPAILNAPPVSPWPPPFLYIPRVTQAMTPYDGDFSSLRLGWASHRAGGKLTALSQ